MWDSIGEALRQSATGMVNRLAGLLPGTVVLTLAMLLAALVAKVAAALLRRWLTRIDFDRKAAQWGLPMLVEWSPSRSPTRLVIRLVWCTILLAGFLVGITAFDTEVTSQFAARLMDYFPNVLAAALVRVPALALIVPLLHWNRF